MKFWSNCCASNLCPKIFEFVSEIFRTTLLVFPVVFVDDEQNDLFVSSFTRLTMWFSSEKTSRVNQLTLASWTSDRILSSGFLWCQQQLFRVSTSFTVLCMSTGTSFTWKANKLKIYKEMEDQAVFIAGGRIYRITTSWSHYPSVISPSMPSQIKMFASIPITIRELKVLVSDDLSVDSLSNCYSIFNSFCKELK